MKINSEKWFHLSSEMYVYYFKVLATNSIRWENFSISLDQRDLMPLIMLILQSYLSRQRHIWWMPTLGSVRDHDASLKASFQLQIPALIQLVSFEDTLIMGSRRADGVNNLRIHRAEGTLSEFISSWLPERRMLYCICAFPSVSALHWLFTSIIVLLFWKFIFVEILYIKDSLHVFFFVVLKKNCDQDMYWVTLYRWKTVN